jgi:hypothetical protein
MVACPKCNYDLESKGVRSLCDAESMLTALHCPKCGKWSVWNMFKESPELQPKGIVYSEAKGGAL